jgi:hypothetical protein
MERVCASPVQSTERARAQPCILNSAKSQFAVGQGEGGIEPVSRPPSWIV